MNVVDIFKFSKNSAVASIKNILNDNRSGFMIFQYDVIVTTVYTCGLLEDLKF